jgi:glutamate N-acetyltransferase/amino-acid N-acetyltransferase
MKKIRLPEGFVAGGMHCGLKKKRKDLALFFSERPCSVAAVFTTNLVKAAPVLLAQEQLSRTKKINAVLVNSGNANCMTGKRGLEDARMMVKTASGVLGVPEDAVLVSSTGVIGKYMNMDPVLDGIPKLAGMLSADGLLDAVDAIMTTDRFRKMSSRVVKIGGAEVTLTGVTKGAGMIDPNMATMLCYIMSDARITFGALKKSLKEAAMGSFNAITVDGDMSTNDTVVVMANGAAGNRTIKAGNEDYRVFYRALFEISSELAQLIVKDGEGTTKVMSVRVKGMKSVRDAKKIAHAIANSLLVKCAVHGGDPNWGRIASSAGSSGVKFDPSKMDIVLDGVTFLKNGEFTSPDKAHRDTVFKSKDIHILVDMHTGSCEAVSYGCDLSRKYLAINSYYTT